MKMSKYKYPVDNDQFQEIGEKGFLYVDVSLLLLATSHNGASPTLPAM